MSLWVYIIQSETNGRYYCGQSSDVDRRLRQHNEPDYRLSKTTKHFAGPWKLVGSQQCRDGSESTLLERRIEERTRRRQGPGRRRAIRAVRFGAGYRRRQLFTRVRGAFTEAGSKASADESCSCGRSGVDIGEARPTAVFVLSTRPRCVKR